MFLRVFLITFCCINPQSNTNVLVDGRASVGVGGGRAGQVFFQILTREGVRVSQAFFGIFLGNLRTSLQSLKNDRRRSYNLHTGEYSKSFGNRRKSSGNGL